MSTTNSTSRRFHASRPLSQLWQVPTFLLGVVALLLVGAQSYFRQDPFAAYFQQELIALREGLDNKAEKLGPLIALAENLAVQAVHFPPRGGEAHFLIGSTYWRQAQEAPEEKAAAIQVRAEEHLEKAINLGVAAGDLAPLQFRLGMVLLLQKKSTARAFELLNQGAEKGADSPARGYELLVEAYLRQAPPDLEAALLRNQKQLENLSDNDEDLARARLTRGELLCRLERRGEALRTLERIGPTASKAVRSKARLLQTRCCEAEGLWRRAIPLYKELLDDPASVPGGKGQILYALGWCQLNNDPSDPEAAAANWQDALTLGGHEGQAAALRLGEMRLQSDARAAIKTWTGALARVQRPADYRNPYIELEQLRELFEGACKQLLEAQDYQTTEQLAELYRRVALPGRAELQLAQATESLARQLDDKTSDQAAALFTRAGKAYEEVAGLRADKEQGEFLWRSASCYLSGRTFPQAAKVLDKFVKVEKADTRLAEGWLALAEAQLALKNKERARQAYYKCIEFDTLFAYRARYQLALDEWERKNKDQAIVILKQNLNTSGGAVDRDAQEKSLFLLGSILFQDQKFDQASVHLKKAVQEYPHNSDIATAREQLADCFRKMGDQAGAKARDTINPEARQHHLRSKTVWLDQAAATYQALADDLESLGRKAPLTRDELRRLRKCLFGIADIYFDMNDLTESLRRYQLLQDRYRKQVESLIACQRIYLCWSRLRAAESAQKAQLFQDAARNAVQMGKEDLDIMDEDSDFFRGGTGVWRKPDWVTWFAFVTAQLNPTNPTAQVPTEGQK